MSKLSAIKRYIRQHNSGGVNPEPMSVLITLQLALHQLKKFQQPSTLGKITSYDRLLFYFIYLWLTGELADCKTIADIPRLIILTGTVECKANALRRVRKNNISWVEYALKHNTFEGVKWLWQPIPNGLNAYFSDVLTKSTTNWGLSSSEKNDFITLLTVKWRTPASLLGIYRIRRNRFFIYFKILANLDNHISTLSKRVLLGEDALHHHSASAYQYQNSEQLRYEIFHAQTRYLDRLSQVPIDSKIKLTLNVPLHKNNTKHCLLDKNTDLPKHLLGSGRVENLHLEQTKATKTYIKTEPLSIGSQRMLEVDKVRHFFSHLHQYGQQLTHNKYSPSTLIALVNFRAYELALLLIVFTGVRPTHSISLEKAYCFNFECATVNDKGRWRNVILPVYLKQAIIRFEQLHNLLKQIFPKYTPPKWLWFSIHNQGEPVALTAKELRLFMKKHWSQLYPNDQVVPYQLRHFFAQHARAALASLLSTQDVDNLMGHSSFGEHLGSGMHFPASQTKLTKHLNGISDFLSLPPI